MLFAKLMTKSSKGFDGVPHLAVGQHAIPKQFDRVQDALMRRSARVGMAQAQETRVRTRRLMPAMKLAHTRFGLAQDETIWREVVQGKLGI
jgi:hypothetical protein